MNATAVSQRSTQPTAPAQRALMELRARPALRNDLEVRRRHQGHGEEVWIADPITQQVVRLSARDYHRLQELTSATAQNQQIAWQEGDQWLLSQAQQAGLLKRSPQAASDVAPRWWHNPLFIKLPGVNADNFAKQLAGCSGWLFSAPAVVAWLTFFLATLVLLLVYSNQLTADMRRLMSFQASHWVIAISILAVTKIVHELAHATVCRRMGAACRQIGVLLMCGTPCLYCDVSDSWRVESPHRRSAIMLAGVYIEWVLASLAAWLWWSSDQPMLRLTCLHLMLICGVSSLLFNLNPLMRYDGYYVLSDLLNVSNLRQRSRQAWQQILISCFAQPVFHWQTLSYAGFHVISAVYRIVVMGALLWWFYGILKAAGIEPFGRMLLCVVCFAVVALQGLRLWRMIFGTGGWEKASRLRRLAIGCSVIFALTLILLTPFSRRLPATGIVDYAGATEVFIPHDAKITDVFHEFDEVVSEGTTLVQLTDFDLDLRIIAAESEQRQLDLQRDSLSKRALKTPELLQSLETIEAAANAARRERELLLQTANRLQVTAPRSGTVLPPQSRDQQSDARPGISYLSLQPVSLQRHQHEFATKGKVWCRIGDPTTKSVHLRITAAERSYYELGKPIRIAFAAAGGRVVNATIDEIALIPHTDQRELSPAASTLGDAYYEVICHLPVEDAVTILVGTSVQSVVRGDETTLLNWIWSSMIGEPS